MCKVGDIIVVTHYKSHGVPLNRHSFVVVSLNDGQICGMDYDMVCTVMSSFHSEEHRQKKLSFPGNVEYDASDETVKNGHGKSGYIKADQLYYFVQSDLNYFTIGEITPELFKRLLERIESMDSIEHITDNLKGDSK